MRKYIDNCRLSAEMMRKRLEAPSPKKKSPVGMANDLRKDVCELAHMVESLSKHMLAIHDRMRSAANGLTGGLAAPPNAG